MRFTISAQQAPTEATDDNKVVAVTISGEGSQAFNEHPPNDA